MKKMKILVIAVLFAIVLTGCGRKGYTEISYDKLNKMVENNETFALFIGKTSCSSCDVFKKVLNDVYAKEHGKDATIYYIDTDALTDSEFAEFRSKYYYEGTPTVTIIVDGKFTSNNSVTGSDKYNDMINKMIEKGLLKG